MDLLEFQGEGAARHVVGSARAGSVLGLVVGRTGLGIGG
jgi:hypothetical protein